MAADVTVAPTLGHSVLMTQGGIGVSPGYDAIDLRRMMQAAGGSREGAFDATGWKVSENSGGANMTVQVAASVGLARVMGESVTHQGPYVVAPHSATITLDVTAAHSTNPRVDLVVLQVRDHTHDAGGQNDARVRILAGTATSGATLDNLNGQQSLPANTLRLADVLVPATDTTIANAQIRDRRTHAGEADVGELKAWAGATAPTGWKLCDGSAINRAVHAEAFAVLSTNYGTGDGSTTFNLPDMQGRVPVGKGTHAEVDALGESDGLSVASRKVKHRHGRGTLVVGNNTGTIWTNTGTDGGSPTGVGRNFGAEPHTHSTSGEIGDTAGPLDGPAYLTVNWIIYMGTVAA